MKTEKHDILHTNQPIKTNAKMTQIFKSPHRFLKRYYYYYKKKATTKSIQELCGKYTHNEHTGK